MLSSAREKETDPSSLRPDRNLSRRSVCASPRPQPATTRPADSAYGHWYEQFAGTGKLRDVITSRRAHQKQRKLIDGREKQKAAKKAHAPKSKGDDDAEDGSDVDEDDVKGVKGKQGKQDDGDIMGEGFMGEEVEEGEDEDDDDEDVDEAENDTDDDFAELDDIEGAFS